MHVYPFFLIFILTLFSYPMMAKTLDPGQADFQRGHFENAAQYWRKTLLNLSPKNSPADYLDTSVRLANAYQHLGHLQNALEVLHCAEAYAEPRKDEDAHRYAKILSRLGSVYLAACHNNCKQNQTLFQKPVCPHKMPQPKQCNGTSKMDKANCYLNKANEHASNDLLKASILNELGNLYVKKKEFKEALQEYRKSIKLAELVENEDKNILKPKVLLNIVQAETQSDNADEAKKALQDALQEVKWLPNSHDKAFALMSIVDLDKYLQSLPLRNRYDLIQDAFEIAKTLENKRAMAYALFYKAQLYAEKQRYEEAIELTRQAIFYTENYPANLHVGIQREIWGYPELLFQLEWQQGKYLKAQSFDKHQTAIGQAYEQANKHLKLVRLAYGNLSPTFLARAKKFYFDWADFWLKKAADEKLNKGKKQKLLKKAIEVIELFGVAQVQEYYHDECITQELEDQVKYLDDHLPNNTAIFYPLLFEDRIVALVVTNEGVEQSIYPVPKDAKNTLTNFIEESKKTCNTTSSTQIYKWFQAAFEKLEQQKINTIALVQNDIWASVPFSAIYNDEKEEFLVQKFAFFATPSIKLTDSRLFSSDNNNQRTLIGGLSISTGGLSRLCYVPSEVVEVAGKLFEIESDDEVLRSQFNNCKNKQYQQYQGVDAESLITSKEEQLDILLDQEFNPSKLKAKFFDDDKGNYSIVHFATHSEFSYDPSKSYILVTGKKIQIEELRSLIKENKRFGKQPEDLLVLSSCESAKGKNLGLATIAINAGIPSVLATLWSIDDSSEMKDLIAYFYQQLRDGKNKAEALKEVQTTSLLNSGKNKEELCRGKYNKPRYWAPFILIGNGLTKIKF